MFIIEQMSWVCFFFCVHLNQPSHISFLGSGILLNTIQEHVEGKNHLTWGRCFLVCNFSWIILYVKTNMMKIIENDVMKKETERKKERGAIP